MINKKKWMILLFIGLVFIYFIIFIGNIKLVTAPLQVPDFYYYFNGNKITLRISKEMLAIRFKEGVSLEDQEVIVKSEESLESFQERKESSTFKLSLLPLRQGVTEEGVIQTINNLNKKVGVEAAFPVFQVSDTKMILTDEFIVKFNSSLSEEEIKAFNELNNVEIVEKPGWTDHYLVKVKDPKNMNALKIANLYYENPITVFSTPNFIGEFKKMSVTPDDTYFPQQWTLNNVGQTPPGGTVDADINASEGWEISTGSSDIVIAIIDSGVDLNHEDLVDKIVAGYDFVHGDNDPSPSPYTDENDAHGTACAGLAAAKTNNAKGIAGVCWNCKIMPVRIITNEFAPAYWTTDWWASSGIEWACDNGADVLSNSWGGGYPSDAIHDAIIEAKNHGRDEKGCVIVFSSGNDGVASVSYPANYTETIAVGATDHNDARWSYSNYGNELDVVAPSGGDSVIMWATDIHGSLGYNPGTTAKGDAAGDYTSNFSGTSGSAPQVSGLAGLILSVNPSFSANETQSIIQAGAADKGASGWDEEYGWGRINVNKSLYNASLYPKINKIECRNATSWLNCSEISFGTNLTRVRVNCTDPDGIKNASFTLKNVPDNKIFFENKNATLYEKGWWIYDNDDIIINDSGMFKLAVTCFDNQGLHITDYGLWTPGGNLKSYLIDPLTNKYVGKDLFFTFKTKIECLNAECGNISATLVDNYTINTTPRTCSQVWGDSCSKKITHDETPEGDNTFDSCPTEYGHDPPDSTLEEHVSEVYLNATSVSPGDMVNLTCEFNCTSWTDYTHDYAYAWYYNGTLWRKLAEWDWSDEPGQCHPPENKSVNFTVDNIIGTHWVRCGILDTLHGGGEDSNWCIDNGYYFDNDDINFTVTRKIPKTSGVPFYVTGNNPILPADLSCLQNMYPGDSCEVSWTVNATGSLNAIHEFYVLSQSINYPDAVVPNETKKINITIIDPSKILTSCQTLSQANKIYYLANDVSSGATCFNISADNITLDGQGYTIRYGTDNVATSYYGVYVTHKYDLRNITVKNLKVNTTRIARDRRGIYFYKVYNSTISNVDASVNDRGIYLYKSDSNALINITINNNTFGLFLNSSHSINLNNGIANNNSNCSFYLFNSSNNNITNSNSWREVSPAPSPTPTPTPTPYYDVYLQGSSSNNDIFLNVSYNYETVDSGSNLTRKWYLDVYVNNSIGVPLQDVLIRCWNVTNALIFSESTGADGEIITKNLTEYINRGGNRNFWTNYTVNASMEGYIQQTRKVNLTTNKFEVFTLLWE